MFLYNHLLVNIKSVEKNINGGFEDTHRGHQYKSTNDNLYLNIVKHF
jgi:hypothetical protein